MKKITLGILLIAVAYILPTSCDKLEDLIKIPISITDQFTIPAGTGIGTIFSPITGSSETNIEQELENNDARKDKIKTVKLRELKLTILTSGKDFSFADSLEIYLNTEGQEEILIATKDDIDPDATSIDMDVVGDDLADYLKQDEISFRAKFENKELDLTSTDVEVFAKFRITVDIF